jgi:hypothetical protein
LTPFRFRSQIRWMNDNHPPPRTIAAAAAAGYTHLHVACDHCGRSADYPFKMVRRAPTTPLAAVLSAMCCDRCGAKPTKATLWHQYMSPGAGHAPGLFPAIEVAVDQA